MKLVSILIGCGIWGVSSLTGMVIQQPDSKIPKLFQLCAVKQAKNIKRLDKLESSIIVDWNKCGATNHVIKLIMESVVIDKDTIAFWLSNVFSLQQSKTVESKLFEGLFELAINPLLALEIDDLASLTMLNSKVIDSLDLSVIKQSLPVASMNERAKNRFPALVPQLQTFFNQPLLVTNNGVTASTDNHGALTISYTDERPNFVFAVRDDVSKITAFKFNKNARRFVVGFKGGKVCIFDENYSGKDVTKHVLAVTAVGLSPNEDIVVSADVNGEICITSVSAGTHVKMWCNELVSNIDFDGDGGIILTKDRVASQRSIPLGSVTITEAHTVKQPIPLNYLKGKLTNQELLIAYIVKRIKEDNEGLKRILASQLGLFMDTNKLFEPVIRGYFRSVIVPDKGS